MSNKDAKGNTIFNIRDIIYITILLLHGYLINNIAIINYRGRAALLP